MTEKNNKNKLLEISCVFISLIVIFFVSIISLNNYTKLYSDKQYADMITCSDNINTQIYDKMMEPLSRVISISEIARTSDFNNQFPTYKIDEIMKNIEYSQIIFAHNDIISSVYPKENEENYLGMDYESFFGKTINFENFKKLIGPVIEGPFILPGTEKKVLASLIYVLQTKNDKTSYWGYVGIIVDCDKLFSNIDKRVFDERQILCKISSLDQLSGDEKTIWETPKKIPNSISKDTITTTKFYFKTPFITTLVPSKTFKTDPSFIFLSAFFIFLCFFIPFIIYKVIHNYTTKQDYEYYKIQSKLLTVQEHTIISLSSLVENRDSDTGAHIKRTSDYVHMISQETKNAGLFKDIITDEFITLIKNAAPMHDIGKIKIPDSILKKPGKLTDEEFEQIKLHTTEGGRIIQDILGPVQSPDFLQISKDIALYHHEKWNGKGYPYGKKGEEIPLSARIMALADVFDALTTPRCYKEPFSFEKAIEIIRNDIGSHFDPQLSEIFLNNQDKLREIMEKYKS